jgi:hypothetical protein
MERRSCRIHYSGELSETFQSPRRQLAKPIFCLCGRTKRQSFYVYRRISLLQLVGEGSLPNCWARHAVERKPKSKTSNS